MIAEPEEDQQEKEEEEERLVQEQYGAVQQGEYEADWDSEELEEEEGGAESREASWLVEQAARGRARQRALQARTGEKEVREAGTGDRLAGTGERLAGTGERLVGRPGSQEKASSRDSAYWGASADSRGPTREPTPDHSRTAAGSRRILGRRRADQQSGGRAGKEQQRDTASPAQLRFLSEVTTDILARGIFSEKGLRAAISSQARKADRELSGLEAESLLRQLRAELGVEAGPGQQQGGAADLAALLARPAPRPGRPPLPPAPPGRKTLQEIREAGGGQGHAGNRYLHQLCHVITVLYNFASCQK